MPNRVVRGIGCSILVVVAIDWHNGAGTFPCGGEFFGRSAVALLGQRKVGEVDDEIKFDIAAALVACRCPERLPERGKIG